MRRRSQEQCEPCRDLGPVRHAYVAVMDNQMIYYLFNCEDRDRGRKIHQMLLQRFEAAARSSKLAKILCEFPRVLRSFYNPQEWTILSADINSPLTIPYDLVSILK